MGGDDENVLLRAGSAARGAVGDGMAIGAVGEGVSTRASSDGEEADEGCCKRTLEI